MTAFLKVNGDEIDIASAIRLEILHSDDFVQNTVRYALVRQYAAKKGIENSDQELQLAADELRYSRGLEKVEAAQQWMRDNHQTTGSIQNGVDTMLLNNKVREAIPDDQVQAWYTEHQLELETVELYSIRVDSESKANELLSQINDEGANFHTLAMEHSQDEETRRQGGYAGALTRSQVTGAVEAAVFKTRTDAIVGPVKTEKGWNLFRVAAVHKPSLEEAKSRVRLNLMKELTNRLLAEAKVEHPVFE